MRSSFPSLLELVLDYLILFDLLEGLLDHSSLDQCTSQVQVLPGGGGDDLLTVCLTQEGILLEFLLEESAQGHLQWLPASHQRQGA